MSSVAIAVTVVGAGSDIGAVVGAVDVGTVVVDSTVVVGVVVAVVGAKVA